MKKDVGKIFGKNEKKAKVGKLPIFRWAIEDWEMTN
jgi:hypothetical protein